MSDDELAKFLLDSDQRNFSVDVCCSFDLDECPCECRVCMLRYLQAPAQEVQP